MQKSTAQLSPEEITGICQEIRRKLLLRKTHFICEVVDEILVETAPHEYQWLRQFHQYLQLVFDYKTLFGALREYRNYSVDTSNLDTLQFRLHIVPVLIYHFQNGRRPEICLLTVEKFLREFVATGSCSTEGMNEND